jgi:predicted enzyme related to lactoylglutathione lyase
MTTTLPAAAPPGGRFAFTKLVVRDLASADAFYRAVCGYGDGQCATGMTAGRPIEEMIYRKPEGGLELVLLSYLDGPESATSGVIVAFDTSDLDAFQERVLAAGGAVIEAIRDLEFNANRMRIGFFSDPDGHLLEVMQR